jgi:hypothetical protein
MRAASAELPGRRPISSNGVLLLMPPQADARALEEYKTVGAGHGRQETKTDAVVAAPVEVDPEGQWCDLGALGIAISERVETRGRAGCEVRYYILGRRIPAEEFARHEPWEGRRVAPPNRRDVSSVCHSRTRSS